MISILDSSQYYLYLILFFSFILFFKILELFFVVLEKLGKKSVRKILKI